MRLGQWKYLWFGITPFIWHWPHFERTALDDYTLRVGPISIYPIPHFVKG